MKKSVLAFAVLTIASSLSFARNLSCESFTGTAVGRDRNITNNQMTLPSCQKMDAKGQYIRCVTNVQDRNQTVQVTVDFAADINGGCGDVMRIYPRVSNKELF